jgi:hypothetical protein
MNKEQKLPQLDALERLADAALVVVADLIKQGALDKNILEDLVEKGLLTSEIPDHLKQALEGGSLSAKESNSQVSKVKQQLNNKAAGQQGGSGIIGK